MKLYLMTQDVVDDWDTYDSVVVSAKDEEDARTIHPDTGVLWGGDNWYKMYYDENRNSVLGVYDTKCWVSAIDIDKIHVTYLGKYRKDICYRGVVLASFNAG